MTLGAHDIASRWIGDVAHSLEAGDVDSLVSTIVPHGFLKDILIFSWNNRTLEGHSSISTFLKERLAHARISNLHLENSSYLAPVYGQIGPEALGISTGFTFETPIALGKGYARIVDDGAGVWKALAIFFMMDSLKGYAEIGPDTGMHGGHTLPWHLVREESRKRVESNPHVIIVGAGQTGLNIGARFKQMGIPTIIIEKEARVGDVWRKRYPTLVLHTPKSQHSLLYQPFPETWPIFSPKDKLAEWLEHYSVSQDLVVWTSSTLQPTPEYNNKTRTWTCIVSHDNTPILLHPSHIVLATGTLGRPCMPSIPTSTDFSGSITHGSSYSGGRSYAGARVAVVGSGNTSADICQDLVFNGAKSVTIVQRGPTVVTSLEKSMNMMLTNWPLDIPVEISDFKVASTPMALLRSSLSSMLARTNNPDAAMLENLSAKGFKHWEGPDGGGYLFQAFSRLGGFWLDVGTAELIHQGKVAVKSNVEVSHFKPASVIFTDGTELEVDSVIFATGYSNIMETFEPVFGKEVISKTPHLWGFDEEQEFRGCYRPSGQSGLWYAAGDFYVSRFYSKPLALQIKAIEAGYMKQE